MSAELKEEEDESKPKNRKEALVCAQTRLIHVAIHNAIKNFILSGNRRARSKDAILNFFLFKMIKQCPPEAEMFFLCHMLIKVRTGIRGRKPVKLAQTIDLTFADLREFAFERVHCSDSLLEPQSRLL